MSALSSTSGRRDRERCDFLRLSGFDPDRAEALPADASPRRYFRLAGSNPPRLAMDAEPGRDFDAFLTVARHLTALGFSAPAIEAVDAARGLAVVEDFGSRTFTRALAEGVNERALYELAVDTLAALHETRASTAVDVPAYDEGPLLAEIRLFADWFAAHAGGPSGKGFTDAFLGLWRDALADVATRRDALVLRDFHVDNLMIVPGRDGIAACGLLDFQDALIGSPAYDLVSLTQDARRDLSPGLETHLTSRYLAARPDIDRARFMAHYHLLGAQRHIKVAGIFLRLSRRDGKHAYLAHMPRVLLLLGRSLDAAGLGAIRDCLDKSLPGWAAWPGDRRAA